MQNRLVPGDDLAGKLVDVDIVKKKKNNKESLRKLLREKKKEYMHQNVCVCTIKIKEQKSPSVSRVFFFVGFGRLWEHDLANPSVALANESAGARGVSEEGAD